MSDFTLIHDSEKEKLKNDLHDSMIRIWQQGFALGLESNDDVEILEKKQEEIIRSQIEKFFNKI